MAAAVAALEAAVGAAPAVEQFAQHAAQVLRVDGLEQVAIEARALPDVAVALVVLTNPLGGHLLGEGDRVARLAGAALIGSGVIALGLGR